MAAEGADHRTEPPESSAASPIQQVLSIASAALVLSLIALTAERVDPGGAGADGAFPAMSTTNALFLAYRVGVRNANAVTGGLVRSLLVHAVYCLAVS